MFFSAPVKSRYRYNMKAGFRLGLGFLLLSASALLFPPVASFAQNDNGEAVNETRQQSESEPSENEEQETRQEEAESQEEISIDADTPPGRFIPSEEISEDLSVPFPVDI